MNLEEQQTLIILKIQHNLPLNDEELKLYKEKIKKSKLTSSNRAINKTHEQYTNQIKELKRNNIILTIVLGLVILYGITHW